MGAVVAVGLQGFGLGEGGREGNPPFKTVTY